VEKFWDFQVPTEITVFCDNALVSHPSTAQLKPVNRNWAFTV